jgi:hypothetical protein
LLCRRHEAFAQLDLGLQIALFRAKMPHHDGESYDRHNADDHARDIAGTK